jgi:hypothetical protein
MSDEFEDLLKRWLRQRGAADRSMLQALAGNVAALPPRRRRQPSNLAAAAAVIVALGLAAFALAPHNGSVSDQVIAPVASGPSGFAGDPRLAACSADVADVDRVFEMVQSRYFPLYFPGWWQGAPELEVDDPALVVIGREQVWPITGAAPGPGQTADPNAGLGYQMCIAVGTPASFIVHNYGVTHFDRIVPVLLADDLARAQHMDPDVLADPANYPVPQRLAACGGITDQVQYVFEARSIDDYPRYFPDAAPLGLVTADEPATIVVYRGLRPDKRGLESYPPNEHDLCILLGPAPGTAKPVFISGVDLTGFHVRLDDTAATETTAPTPDTAPPTSTPTPGPYWAGDYVAAALQCDGRPADFGSNGITEAAVGSRNPNLALGRYLAEVKKFGLLFPTEGFAEVEVLDPWALFGYQVGGRTRAAVALRNATPGVSGEWEVAAVASCDPSEFDPATPLGTTITIWTDQTGNVVPTTVVREQADCYNATQLEVNGRLFVWDPNLGGAAYDPSNLEGTFETNMKLPATATDTGYRSGSRSLYIAADGSAVYVRNGKIVERWPHVKGDEVIRIDCN